jgi:hypothetical protein
LRKVYEDPSRDRATRETAADALRALGEDPDAGTGPDEPIEKEPPKKVVAEGTPGGGDEEPLDEDVDEPVQVPEASRFSADTLAASERLTLAVGSLALTFDTVRDRPQLAGAAAGRYQRGLEKTSFGYTIDAGVALSGGALDRDPDPDSSSLAFMVNTAGAAEARFYLGGQKVFAAVEAGLALGASAFVYETAMPGAMDAREFLPSVDLNLGLGGGYGRTLDVGPTMRLRRIETVLRRARLLGRPISADVAARIHTAWWGLRGELGSLARLRATLQLMREAGVLLQDPDPSTVYKLIKVLEDGALDDRREGWDVRVGVGETIVGRDEGDDFDLDREETAFLRAQLGRQLPGDTELRGSGRALIRLTESPRYWFASADLSWRRYFYGPAWDTRGALEIGAVAAAAALGIDGLDTGTMIGGRVAWIFFPNRASFIRLSGAIDLEQDELFVGIRVDGSFGFLPRGFSAW